MEKIKRWIREGGIVIAQKRAARWAGESGLGPVRFHAGADEGKEAGRHEHHEDPSKGGESPKGGGGNGGKKAESETKSVAPLPYGEYHDREDRKRTSGAIFRVRLDRTHPMGFGFQDETLPVFRNSNLVMLASKSPYATPLRYHEDPLISGYVHPENLERFRSSAEIVAEKVGRGEVIALVDNPNFRAF